jgi:arylsulfatase A
MLRTWLAVAAATLGMIAQQPSSPPPNLVIIFTDDLGYGDLGSFGSPNNRTPRLDAMAAEGQKWTNGCRSAAACTACRE